MMLADNIKPLMVYSDGKGPDKVYGGCGYYRTVQPSRALGYDFRGKLWGDYFNTDTLDGLGQMMEYFWKQSGYNMWISERFDSDYMTTAIIASRDLFDGKVIIDMDDDFNNVHDDNLAKEVYDKGKKVYHVTEVMFSEADGLTVSTEKLKRLYSKYNSNIEVFENKVEPNYWRNVFNRKHQDGLIRIGWTGGISHHADLAPMTGVLNAVLRQYNHVRLRVMGYFPPEWLQLPIEKIERGTVCPMSEYPKGLADNGIDIGIAPLQHTEFNQAKSNIKYLEYSMLGIPSICQDGMDLPYAPKIQRDVNGVLAESPNEWLAALVHLIEDEPYRKSVGQEAYKNASNPANRFDADADRRRAFYADTYSGKRFNEKRGYFAFSEQRGAGLGEAVPPVPVEQSGQGVH